MSDKRSDEQLRIDVSYSPRIALFLLIIHGGALAVVPILTLPIWIALGITLGVVASLITTLHTHAFLYSRLAVASLIWGSDGHWSLAYVDGVVRDAELMPDYFVHPLLVVLNFRVADAKFPWRRQSVILTPDAVNPTNFRRLRVRLRTEHQN